MLRRESPTRLYYKKIGALHISEGNVATSQNLRFDDFHLEEDTFSERCSRARAFNAAFARSHRRHQILVLACQTPPRFCPWPASGLPRTTCSRRVRACITKPYPNPRRCSGDLERGPIGTIRRCRTLMF